MVDLLWSGPIKLALVIHKNKRLVVFIHRDRTKKAHQVCQGELVEHLLVINRAVDNLRLVLLHLLELLVHRVLDDQSADESF